MKIMFRVSLMVILFAGSGVKAGELVEAELKAFIAQEVSAFHERRLEKLTGLELDEVLERKNPYLLKASGVETPDELVRELLDLYLSSQEAGLFGTTFEQIVIFVCGEVYGGRKSGIEGVDLEFEKGDTKYIVSIKSGPSWGNSSSIKAMRDHFAKAKRVLGTNTSGASVIAVNGCCYGKEAQADKGDYLKLCGQPFWELISGDPDLYLTIHKMIGEEFDAQRDAFESGYADVVKRITSEVATGFTDGKGRINWAKLVETNSGAASEAR
jgi:hypothetical protein